MTGTLSATKSTNAATLMVARIALTVALSRVPMTSRPVISSPIAAAGRLISPPNDGPRVSASGISMLKDRSSKPTK